MQERFIMRRRAEPLVPRVTPPARSLISHGSVSWWTLFNLKSRRSNRWLQRRVLQLIASRNEPPTCKQPDLPTGSVYQLSILRTQTNALAVQSKECAVTISQRVMLRR